MKTQTWKLIIIKKIIRFKEKKEKLEVNWKEREKEDKKLKKKNMVKNDKIEVNRKERENEG